jgi:hypothetical protein
MPRESFSNPLRLPKPGSQLKNTVPHGSDTIIEHRLARVFVALAFRITR